MGEGGQQALVALTLEKRPSTHSIEGWVGPKTRLDGCRKSHPHQDLITGPSSPQQVALPTMLAL